MDVSDCCVFRTVTEEWCQAVRELYELHQSSATDRRGKVTQNTIANAVTYGTFRDDVPNKYDNQQFLYSNMAGIGSNRSRHSGSLITGGRQNSESPATILADVIQTPKSNYQVEETPQLLYPPTAEITPEARRNFGEERAVLEAMTQTATSLPVTPYFGPTMFQGSSMSFTLGDPADRNVQLGTHMPSGMGWAMDGNNGINMEDFPSLDEIISSMEGMRGQVSVGGITASVGGGSGGGGQMMEGLEGGDGLDDGFGFLDDLGLFDDPMI